ncbi:MAG: biotin--[acetyl-CoA-carboxylase] ligase [Arenicellales bacterium]
MSTTEREPNLPGLYELVVVDRTDSARAHAERLAMQGADEGTLVWVRKQTEGTGRSGKYWISGDRNLHCAVILRPEDPLSVCCQLSLVASVSTAQAITVVGEPMEELRLGWPNDIYLNRGKVAAVHLSGRIDAGGGVEWVVVSINVNTFAEPSVLGVAAASLRGEGFEVCDRVVLLESFSRAFLAWLNRWAEEGLEPVLKAWSWRGDWEGERSLEYGGRRYLGEFESLENDGTLKLRTTEGIMSFGLTGFHSPEFLIASHGSNR